MTAQIWKWYTCFPPEHPVWGRGAPSPLAPLRQLGCSGCSLLAAHQDHSPARSAARRSGRSRSAPRGVSPSVPTARWRQSVVAPQPLCWQLCSFRKWKWKKKKEETQWYSGSWLCLECVLRDILRPERQACFIHWLFPVSSRTSEVKHFIIVPSLAPWCNSQPTYSCQSGVTERAARNCRHSELSLGQESFLV